MTTTTKDTYYIYLDSDHVENTVSPQDPEFRFAIQPSIQTQTGELCTLFVKDFSTMNDFYNVTAFNRRNQIIYGTTVVELLLDTGHYDSGTKLIAHIASIFQKHVNVNIPTSTPVPNFTFDEKKLKGIFRFNGDTLKFSGLVFTEIFNLDESVPYPDSLAISASPVDVNRNIHNIYLSINELNNTNTVNVSSALNIPNRVCKVPIISPFGGYCVFQSSQYPQKTPVSNHLINNLTFKLFLDNGSTLSSEKFTCTIVLEIERPVVKPAHPIQDMPNGYYSTSANIPFLNKPVHRRC